MSEPTVFTQASEAARFIFAGNAYFTLRSKKTQTRYTYRVSAVEDSKNPLWFVSVLAGPDNNSDYQYIGLVNDDMQFRRTKKSKMLDTSLPVVAISYALKNLSDSKIPESLEIWHEGRCGRCGRKLTVPESIAAGIGPECSGKMLNKEPEQEHLNFVNRQHEMDCIHGRQCDGE